MKGVIEEIISADLIAKFLLDRSILTQIQLDTYMVDHFGRKQGVKLAEKIALRDKKPVKKGAFMRTLRQAQANIKKSVCTIILAEYFGLLDRKTFAGLLQIGNMIASIDEGALTTEQKQRVLDQLIRIIGSFEVNF